MTATNDAPDTEPTPEDRWHQLLNRIHDLEAQVTATTSAATTALDTHLARLDALRHHLAQSTWPLPDPDPDPGPGPGPGPGQPAPGHSVPHRRVPPAQVGKTGPLSTRPR